MCIRHRYIIKWPLALLVGILSVLFWRVPSSDDDIVAIVEGTSMVTVLRRDLDAEKARRGAQPDSTQEERYYKVDVKDCRLEHVIHKVGSKLGPEADYESKVNIESWSLSYTKTRAADNPSAPWTSTIHSFRVNGEEIKEPERRYAFLHFYLVSSAHTKSHTFGEGLVERILADDHLWETLAESTWTTTALHYGLLHGTMGPVTTVR